MSAQGDRSAGALRGPEYRWARRLFLTGVLVALVSVIALVVARGTGDDSPSPGATPPTMSGAPGAPGVPPDALPGESADEYRWRAEADQLRSQARNAVQSALESADPALQAQLQHVVDLLDDEARAAQLWREARASDAAGNPPVSSSGAGTDAGGVTTAVALVGALGGLLTAAAGLLTALVAWRKAVRGR